jgi:hypothetical protein
MTTPALKRKWRSCGLRVRLASQARRARSAWPYPPELHLPRHAERAYRRLPLSVSSERGDHGRASSEAQTTCSGFHRVARLRQLLGPFMEDDARRRGSRSSRSCGPSRSRLGRRLSDRPGGRATPPMQLGYEPHLVARIAKHFVHFADFGASAAPPEPPRSQGNRIHSGSAFICLKSCCPGFEFGRRPSGGVGTPSEQQSAGRDSALRRRRVPAFW